jgi:hypothetical protein
MFFLDEMAEGGFYSPRGPTRLRNHGTVPGKSLMLALQPPGIDDAVAMLVAGAGLGGGRSEEASHADLKRLVRSVGNLPLAVDQAAYGSSMKELLDLYESEEIVEVIGKHSIDSGAIAG